jgi:o-succinylbenzoate synthase
MVRIDEVELRRVAMPLVGPFTTSFGTQRDRDVLLLRLRTTEGLEGWGECVAMSVPWYSSEYVDGATEVIRRFLLPPLLALEDVRAEDVARQLDGIVGHRMAKAAVEMAVLDAELRTEGRSLADRLGAVRGRVDCGVSVGIADNVDALLEQVAYYLDDGYLRIKLKIAPGWDVQPVGAVRETFGEDLLLQVDGNAGYDPDRDDHRDSLRALDRFGLVLIEQPYPEERLRAHADLAVDVATPVCLDESITSAASTADALDLGACSIVNIKAGRVGGYLEAARIHDLCVERGVTVWCGGMLETGLGRAANVALAALPGFTLPGDTSASRRYFTDDITPPFELENGQLEVPAGPGLGIDPIPDILDERTTGVETVRA